MQASLSRNDVTLAPRPKPISELLARDKTRKMCNMDRKKRNRQLLLAKKRQVLQNKRVFVRVKCRKRKFVMMKYYL